MRIAFGSDHAGYELKEELKAFLSRSQIDYKDFGTYNNTPCDYPDYVEKVCQAVLSKEFDRGVLICGSGIGMSIAANKIKGIYAALCDNTYVAEMARKHNNTNVLVLPGRIIGKTMGVEILKIWLAAEYEGGRHEKRIEKIRQIENKNFK